MNISQIIEIFVALFMIFFQVLISIQSLLTDPFTDVCMEPEIGNLYAHNRPMFDAVARQWTWKYAMWDALSAKAKR